MEILKERKKEIFKILHGMTMQEAKNLLMDCEWEISKRMESVTQKLTVEGEGAKEEGDSLEEQKDPQRIADEIQETYKKIDRTNNQTFLFLGISLGITFGYALARILMMSNG